MSSFSNLTIRPGKVFHSLIFFTLFFPFIPSIVPSADTQPSFFLLMMLSLLYLLVQYKALPFYYNISYNKLLILMGLLGLVMFYVILNIFFISKPIIYARIFAFFQFTLAVFFALTSRYFFAEKTLKRVFLIFAVFSVIFFLSHGLVERILIPSRQDSFEMLIGSGRGARTLSPEPSFFALHILNLFVIYNLLFGSVLNGNKEALLFFTAGFCLLISLSGYGMAIFMVMLLLRYTKTALGGLVLLMALSGVLLEYLQSFQQFRAIGLLLNIVSNNPAVLLKTDMSFLSRFGSFFEYVRTIKSNIFIGDGFTLYQGGGYISIISSLGILGLFFFVYLVTKIFFKNTSVKVKMLLVFWFLINFFSGPIGVPTLGFIIGLILRERYSDSNQLIEVR